MLITMQLKTKTGDTTINKGKEVSKNLISIKSNKE